MYLYLVAIEKNRNENGRLAKSVISDVTTYRISTLMHRTDGSDTYYYCFAGRRIAMRGSARLKYYYPDNLHSTMVTTGTAISGERYTPWGTARDASQQAAGRVNITPIA
jgi:hypothetical protein